MIIHESLKRFLFILLARSVDNEFRASRSSTKIRDLCLYLQVLLNYKSSSEEDVLEMVLWSPIDVLPVFKNASIM